MAATPSSIAMVRVGSQVWVKDPPDMACWIDGEVIEVNGNTIKVKCSNNKTLFPMNLSDVHGKDPNKAPRGVDDMTKLAYLNEPEVLQNLKSRYLIGEIYTYIGNILIAVNPFRSMDHLYDTEMMKKYEGADFGKMGPHPYAVADLAYRKMLNGGNKNQSILLSGESGAGKTETTKLVLRYLAYLSGKGKVAASNKGQTMDNNVLQYYPILEAFGNANTDRNNNSSRFGKFVKIQFDQTGRISGACITTYLLEVSRVCQISDAERNYHCFYMLCAAPPEERERYKLGDPKAFHYLNQSNYTEIESRNEAKRYLKTREAMDKVGISSEEQEAIFRVVAAILHLGNVEFAEGGDSDSSEPKDEKSMFHLSTAAELLMCNEESLKDLLCLCIIMDNKDHVNIPKSLNPETAKGRRDAFAKILYSRLFDWLVNKINNSIGQDQGSKCSIGLLDIYEFENLKKNSFEQFCINLTNEKLQQHFSQNVLKMEQEEYTKEKIICSCIPEFYDHKGVLDLIEEKRYGIIALLDEACIFPYSTHKTFAEKLYQTNKNNKHFSRPKFSQSKFTICHYAGHVTYRTKFFLEKNKYYNVQHEDLLSASKCAFVSGLFPLLADFPKHSKSSSIASEFKQHLQDLMDTLNATDSQYIRCVKPNNLSKPTIFENQNVLQQLICGGVMEAINIINCTGHPTRRTFYEFKDHFGYLAPDVSSRSSDGVGAEDDVRCSLKKVDNQDYQADLMGAKSQETTKLQDALQAEEQRQYEETKEMLVQEREAAAKKAAEIAAVIKEVRVTDTVLMNKHRHENEKLKSLVSSLGNKIDDTETKHEETSKISVMDADQEMATLRFQRKISATESEGKVQTQAVSTSVESTYEHSLIPIAPKIQGNVDVLNWKSFVVENTSIFGRLIQLIRSAVQVLSIQQLYRICTQYWDDDKLNTQSVSSSDALSNIRVPTREDSMSDESSPFLSDDNNLSIPFSVDDSTSSVQEI